MDSAVTAALASWKLDPRVLAILIVTALVYLRGWLLMRRQVREPRDGIRLTAFLSGLAVVFLATESPLDAFDGLLLSAHMTQHLLLMMIAPPLLLWGQPTVPLLRGLPKAFVKEALAPFLTWPALRSLLRFFVAPPVAWWAFAVSTIGWHLPASYELALSSPAWHGAQHACFFWTGILYWWPVLHPGQGKNAWPQWIFIPYLLFADIVNTALSAFFVFSGNLLYPTYAAVRFSGINPQDDQILAGAIMWVPGSLIYLIPAFVFTMRVVAGGGRRRATASGLVHIERMGTHQDKRKRLSAAKLPLLRRMAQVVMLLVAVAVITDGLRGPQVAPMNLAGVLPWIHWRALSVLALLVVGNLFCMSCPFTLVRDMGRTVLPAKWRWPRGLRSKWLPVVLIVLYLWAYEAFSLWDKPAATAWIIVGYFLAALTIDGLFRGASFCKYVCPIGQFHFVTSLISPREVRVRNAEVCQSCRTHDCIRGNERARGCELYLFQPKKAGNLDCTFCLDCVKACPHDNVSLLPVMPASTLLEDPYRSSLGRLSKRTDLAALALLIVFGAFVNAAGMIEPVMMWEHSWHFRVGANMMPAVVGAFVLLGAIMVPAAIVLLCGACNTLVASAAKVADLTRRFVFTLVPIGVAMWTAHLLYHFATGWNGPLAAIKRIAGQAANGMAMPLVPDWLTPAQILLLNAGLLLTLYIAWRVAKESATQFKSAVALLLPWAMTSCLLYAGGVWILLQPMEMRGMVH